MRIMNNQSKRVFVVLFTLLYAYILPSKLLSDEFEGNTIIKSQSKIVAPKTSIENSQSRILSDLSELEALTKELEQKTIVLRKSIEESAQLDNSVSLKFLMADDLKSSLNAIVVKIDDTKIFDTDYKSVILRNSNIETLYSGPLPPGKRKITAQIHFNDEREGGIIGDLNKNIQIVAEIDIEIPFGKYSASVDLILKRNAKKVTELAFEVKENADK
ncbi:MAG: hypothetical protein KBD78_11985 [Oligoflexales bacterium]|nr:hypothetical protein [Oligoflexales bacterium]